MQIVGSPVIFFTWVMDKQDQFTFVVEVDITCQLLAPSFYTHTLAVVKLEETFIFFLIAKIAAEN